MYESTKLRSFLAYFTCQKHKNKKKRSKSARKTLFFKNKAKFHKMFGNRQKFYQSTKLRSFLAYFTCQKQLKKNAQNQRAKLIFSKNAKILLFNFELFQQVFNDLKLNNLAKEARTLKLEDRI